MLIHNIKADEIRTLLKFDGITFDESDEDLEILIKSKLQELEGLIGIDIFPKDRTSMNNDFIGRVYELDFYPVSEIHRIFIDDKLLHPNNYKVNYDTGIIYFNKSIGGEKRFYYPRRHGYGYGRLHGHRIRVEYTTGLDINDVQYIITPLIKDMIGYTISYGKVNNRLNGLGGFVNSMHEGDLSLNFGSNNGAGNSNYGYNIGINNKIDELARKYRYSARVKWI